MIALEDRATMKGFAAARNGVSKDSNPYDWSKSYREAWDHGWGCWNEKIFPFALEKSYRESGRDYAEISKARVNFEVNRELPPELERIVNIYSH